MLAAAVRPYFSIAVDRHYIKINAGAGCYGRRNCCLVVSDRRSEKPAPTTWMGARSLRIGDLDISFAHSESWRRWTPAAEQSANDSKAAA